MIRTNQNIDHLTADEKVALACRDAGEQAILRAEQTGTPVIIWREGIVVHLSAAEARAEWDRKKERTQRND